MTSQIHSPEQNGLLGALPKAELDLLRPMLELVVLPLGMSIYRPGEVQHYAYFPITAAASLHYVTESGASAESAGVGNEGMIGVALFMGGNATSSSAVVQKTGHAYRMQRVHLQQAFAGSEPLRGLLLRYTLALMTQMSQTAACNRHHSVLQQLCRWLLMTLDRAPDHELVITQELVASLLGVRRESITEAAGALQRQAHIRYRRGHIMVLSRTGLEQQACECYHVVRSELRRLLPNTHVRAGAPVSAA